MHWPGRKRRIFSVWLAITAWVAVGLVVPVIMNFNSTGFVAPSGVVAASRDVLVMDSPVVLSLAPGVTVERATIVRAGSAVIQAPAPGDGSKPRPTQHLTLENAVISIDAGIGRGGEGPGGVSDIEEAPLVIALAQAGYEVLTLKRSTVVLKFAGASLDALRDVNATVRLRRKNVVAIKGTGRLRGRQLQFDATIGGASQSRDGQKQVSLPINLTIKAGSVAQGHFDGKLIVAESLEFDGQGEVAIGSGREMARWFGAYWLSGSGLRDIKAKGHLILAKRAIAFDDAVFDMDGNRATGAMALRFAKLRPELAGTLAAKVLDATRYIGGVQSNRGRERETVSWASLSAGPLTVPLGMHLDADVRISADQVKLGATTISDAAAAIALKDGRLLADFAELKFSGGTGGGQIAADFTGFVPKVAVRGKLENVDLGQLSKLVAGQPVVQAPGMLIADVTSNGFTLQDLMAGLSGKLSIASAEAGRLGVDLGKLGARRDGADVEEGWGAALKGVTAFDKLILKLVLRDGVMMTEQAETLAGMDSWAATGLFNLSSNRIDVRLTKSALVSGKPTGKPSTTPKAPPAILEMRGPWNRPMVRNLSELDLAIGAPVAGGPNR